MFGRKKKRLVAEAASTNAANAQKDASSQASAQSRVYAAPSAEEYRNYIRAAKEKIEVSLDEYGRLAEELRVAAKKISRVKGIFASKLSRRKERKHGAALKTYNDSLTAFITASGEINWLIESVASCYEGLARAADSPRAARRIREDGERYSAAVACKKAKHDKRVDGVVMPISSYVR